MTRRSAICCAVLLAFSTTASSADKKHPKKPLKHISKSMAKTASMRSAKPKVDKTGAKAATTRLASHAMRLPQHSVIKASLKPAAPAAALHGPREILACREGTEDRHARIAVVLVGGRTDSFAYYSKWKPRTCSIYLQRNRDSSRWSDSGSVTNISAEKALFTIDHGRGEYRIVFRDVDRERYCGMEGAINGTLTLRRGSDRCEIAGIMEEGVPLGQAVAYAEAAAAVSPAPTAQPTAAAGPVGASAKAEPSFFKRLVKSAHHTPSPTWTPGVTIGD